jgi:hypothetical protein
VDELGAVALVVGEAVEQAVEMGVGPGAALGGEAGRLVDDDGLGIAVDDDLVDESDLVLAQPRPFRLRLGRGRRGAGGLGGRNPDRLAGLDPIARSGALARRSAAARSGPSARRC